MNPFSRLASYNSFYGPLRTCGFIKNKLVLEFHRRVLRRAVLLKRFSKGFSMYLDLVRPGISGTLGVIGGRELDQIYLLERELRPGHRVMDLGANIGFYALLEAKRVGREGAVLAIEPDPHNYELLRRNISLNDADSVIEARPIGVSNRSGTAQFHLHEMSNLNTLHPREELAEGGVHGFTQVLEIQVVHIAELLRERAPIHLLRMDIEGHEVEVLEGLVEAVAEGHRPRVLFEVHPPKYREPDHSLRLALEGLFEAGYEVLTLVARSSCVPLLESRGYTVQRTIKTDGRFRHLFDHVAPHDALGATCDAAGVRAVLLGPASAPAEGKGASSTL